MSRNVIQGDDFHNSHDISDDNDGIVIHSCSSDIGYDCDNIDREKREYRDILEGYKNPTIINVNIFRYKFTDEFMVKLFQFSKIHQYDHRSVFKEAWVKWIEENEELVCKELNRLEKLNYHGDIMDKMFKSARYYFRKKGTKKKEPVDRREYITMDAGFLHLMDEHISKNVQKPSEGFIQFCDENREKLKEEVKKMVDLNMSLDLIKEKVKKTYKNRYFIFVNVNKKKNCE